jgi:hypothetical protein
MEKRSELMLLGLAASMLMALAVGSASARNLSVNERSLRAVWTPATFIAGGSSARCNLTIEASFHYRTIVKREGALSGFVTRAILNTCTGGSSTVLSNTLPWHITYGGFGGTLPNITALRLSAIGASFTVRPEGSIACLARSTAENPVRAIANVGAGGSITGLRLDETAQIPLEGFFCAFGGEGSFRGTGAATALGGGSVVVRLI